jgi:hypothetical protein
VREEEKTEGPSVYLQTGNSRETRSLQTAILPSITLHLWDDWYGMAPMDIRGEWWRHAVPKITGNQLICTNPEETPQTVKLTGSRRCSISVLPSITLHLRDDCYGMAPTSRRGEWWRHVVPKITGNQLICTNLEETPHPVK